MTRTNPFDLSLLMLSSRPIADTLAVILCGGQSRRFGSPKHLAMFEGEPLLDRIVRRVLPTFPTTVLASASLSGRSPDMTFDPGVDLPLVFDRIPGAGPAAGIEAGLKYAETVGARGVWCLPCDAPWVDPALGSWLAGEALADEVERPLLPGSNGPLGFEPAFGWYPVSASPTIEALLDAGVRALHQLAPSLGARTVQLPAKLRVADKVRLFYNINTMEDFCQASLEATQE